MQLCMLKERHQPTASSENGIIKDDLTFTPLLFALCGGHDNYDTGIKEYRKYKDNQSCSPLLFSLCGGDDNKIQEYRKYKDDL